MVRAAPTEGERLRSAVLTDFERALLPNCFVSRADTVMRAEDGRSPAAPLRGLEETLSEESTVTY